MIYQDPYLLKNCIVAEHRKVRPTIDERAEFCPFCPGHESDIEKIWVEARENDDFLVRVVNNKYPICDKTSGLYGIHDVVIDTPRHLEHPKDFSENHWRILLEIMQERWFQMAEDSQIVFIQIFKNYGPEAGASIKHSHWQMVALGQIPYQMQRQYSHYHVFSEATNHCYLCNQIQSVEKSETISENDQWIVIAPKVSEFAYETWLIPKNHKKHYGELDKKELEACGILLKQLLKAYDKFKQDCPFNICFMSGGLYQHQEYHFYIKIIPRISNWAGFELATHCYINTVYPKTHVQLMRSLLKE